MPPDDFKTNKQGTGRQRRPYALMALVPLMCGTGGLVAANVFGSDFGSALRIATDSGISMKSAMTLIEICSDKLGSGFGPSEAQIAMEQAAQTMRDMHPAKPISPF